MQERFQGFQVYLYIFAQRLLTQFNTILPSVPKYRGVKAGQHFQQFHGFVV